MRLYVHSAVTWCWCPKARKTLLRIYQDIQYNGQIPQVLEDDKIRVPVDAKVVTSKTGSWQGFQLHLRWPYQAATSVSKSIFSRSTCCIWT